MARLDGTEHPLTLGQALVEIAQRIGWGDSVHQDEVIKTLHTAFPDDVTPIGPAPNTGVTDPMIAELNNQAIALAKQGQELAELRAQLAEAQLAEARAKLAAIDAGAKPSDVGVTEQTVRDQAPAGPGPVDLAAAAARSRGEVPLGDGQVITEDQA
jgi:hypothetical protein